MDRWPLTLSSLAEQQDKRILDSFIFLIVILIQYWFEAQSTQRIMLPRPRRQQTTDPLDVRMIATYTNQIQMNNLFLLTHFNRPRVREFWGGAVGVREGIMKTWKMQ